MAGKEIATGELMEKYRTNKRDEREGKPVPCRTCKHVECFEDCPHLDVYEKYLRERPLDT